MGFFSKLFGEKISNANSTNLTKTSSMLEGDVYWRFVAEGFSNSETQYQTNFLFPANYSINFGA